jgi:lactoylglutathione lyase
MELLHTAIWVSDPQKITDFYTDTLDLEPSRDFEGPDGAHNYFLVDESGTELQLKHSENGEEVQPGGMDHIALSVKDVDEVVDRATREWDVDVMLEPKDGMNDVRIAFIKDPEGYTIELIQPL